MTISTLLAYTLLSLHQMGNSVARLRLLGGFEHHRTVPRAPAHVTALSLCEISKERIQRRVNLRPASRPLPLGNSSNWDHFYTFCRRLAGSITVNKNKTPWCQQRLFGFLLRQNNIWIWLDILACVIRTNAMAKLRCLISSRKKLRTRGPVPLTYSKYLTVLGQTNRYGRKKKLSKKSVSAPNNTKMIMAFSSSKLSHIYRVTTPRSKIVVVSLYNIDSVRDNYFFISTHGTKVNVKFSNIFVQTFQNPSFN